ncbi:MAG: Ham1 family, partial [Pseudomonadota bacterium]
MIFATSNPHKVQEARAILAPLGIELQSLADVGCELVEPE